MVQGNGNVSTVAEIDSLYNLSLVCAVLITAPNLVELNKWILLYNEYYNLLLMYSTHHCGSCKWQMDMSPALVFRSSYKLKIDSLCYLSLICDVLVTAPIL